MYKDTFWHLEAIPQPPALYAGVVCAVCYPVGELQAQDLFAAGPPFVCSCSANDASDGRQLLKPRG